MGPGFESILNEAMAELDKQRTNLNRLHGSMEEVTGSARSKRRQISVTVDARGDITEFKFHGTGYRNLSPAELADLIVQTIRQAREAAQGTLAESLHDSLPAGVSSADLAAGRVDWASAFSDALTLPQPLMDLIGGFEASIFEQARSVSTDQPLDDARPGFGPQRARRLGAFK